MPNYFQRCIDILDDDSFALLLVAYIYAIRDMDQFRDFIKGSPFSKAAAARGAATIKNMIPLFRELQSKVNASDEGTTS